MSLPPADAAAAALIGAALDLLAEAGAQAFSLRAVALAAGVAPSMASRRFGDRAGLLAAVTDTLLAREDRALADFAARLGAPCTARELGPVMAAWFAWRGRWSGRQARALAELQGLGGPDRAVSRAADLYAAALVRLAPDLAPEPAVRLGRMAVVEGVWWLALGDEPWFTLLSGETLARAVDPAIPAVWADRFAASAEGLRAGPAGRAAAIASAAADVIASKGPPAVTHRSVAARAGVGLSSVVLQYRTLDALLDAGVAAAGRRHLAGGGDPTAPFDAPLRALASPGLTPAAAQVRRALGAEPDRLAACAVALAARSGPA